MVAQSDTAWALDAYGTSTATGVLAGSASGFAAWFNGNVDVDGNLSKAGGSFKIDHPLDPSNKYLYHSFVESPDMKNIYDGNVTTNGNGDAVVTLPKWFETLNRDFRYQLTVIGQFAQAIVGSEISHRPIQHQDRQAEREGLLAGDRYPARRMGQCSSHSGRRVEAGEGARFLPPSRAIRRTGRKRCPVGA